MSSTVSALSAVAFGADPGRWPLPSATDPDELWLRAVAAGGQGRYASARADLATARLQESQRFLNYRPIWKWKSWIVKRYSVTAGGFSLEKVLKEISSGYPR